MIDVTETQLNPASFQQPMDIGEAQLQFSVYKQLMDITYRLDKIDWRIEYQTRDHPITTEFFLKMKQELHECFKDYTRRTYTHMIPGCGDELLRLSGYIFEKYERVFQKVFNLGVPKSIPSHQPLVLEGISNTAIICPSFQGTQVSCAIERLSFHLRNWNNPEALAAFNELPPYVQKEIYDALWIVRGCPSVEHGIGHENFGEVSYKGREPRCASTPRQKACAVELVKMQTAVLEMIQCLERGDMDGCRKALETLPLEMQHAFYRWHWELIGRPTKNHPDESLRKIAHWDFGRVSFYGLEPRCVVSVEKKIETCEAYLIDLKLRNSIAQKLVEVKKAEWYKNEIDRDMPREDRIFIKKKDLHFLAMEIVPLFLGAEILVVPPEPVIHSLTGEQDDSYATLASGYVEKYPCLRPFFLQMINTLDMKD